MPNRKGLSRQEHIEYAVRQRLAEALASHGVGFDRISLEVLYWLPPSFVDAYVDLYTRAFRDPSQGQGNPNALNMGPARRGQIKGATNNSGKKYRQHWQIKDDTAFERKTNIDQRLMRLVGDMKQPGLLEEVKRERCKGCGRWAQTKWRYCSWCGEKASWKIES